MYDLIPTIGLYHRCFTTRLSDWEAGWRYETVMLLFTFTLMNWVHLGYVDESWAWPCDRVLLFGIAHMGKIYAVQGVCGYVVAM